jgi:hypothetical protein
MTTGGKFVWLPMIGIDWGLGDRQLVKKRNCRKRLHKLDNYFIIKLAHSIADMNVGNYDAHCVIALGTPAICSSNSFLLVASVPNFIQYECLLPSGADFLVDLFVGHSQLSRLSKQLWIIDIANRAVRHPPTNRLHRSPLPGAATPPVNVPVGTIKGVAVFA